MKAPVGCSGELDVRYVIGATVTVIRNADSSSSTFIKWF